MEQRPPRALVSLAGIVAPAGWLSLSLTSSQYDNNNDAAAAAEAAHVAAPAPVVASSPANSSTTQVQLPPKKRKRSSSGGSVHQETAARPRTMPVPPAPAPVTSSSGSSSISRTASHSLAIIVSSHGIAESNSSAQSVADGDDGIGETRSAAAGVTATLAAMPAAQPKTLNAAAATPVASTAEDPIDAVPLRAAAPSLPYVMPAPPLPLPGPRVPPPEPAWIRPSLGLPDDLPLHYITRKQIQTSDLEPQQSRLLLRRDDVTRRLPPLLSNDERRSAGLHEPWARPKPHPQPAAQGEKQAGLLVPVFVNSAGFRINAELTRWSSNGNTVIKFRGEFRRFVTESGVRKDDEIQVWAFRRDGVLHFVMSRTAAQKPPPAPAATIGGQEETRDL